MPAFPAEFHFHFITFPKKPTALTSAFMTIFLLSSSTAQRKRLLHAFLCVLAAFLRQFPFCFAHILLNTVKKRSIRRTNRRHPINLNISDFHKNWFSKPKPLRYHCWTQYAGNASQPFPASPNRFVRDFKRFHVRQYLSLSWHELDPDSCTQPALENLAGHFYAS